MRKLPKPVNAPLYNYDKCIERIGCSSKASLFYSCFSQLNALMLNYQLKACNNDLYTIPSISSAGNPGLGSLSTDDFKKLYTTYMVNQDERHASRKIYDSIKASALKCPLCGFGEIYEVDHYLPKSEFPVFSVFSDNLIPCCHPCNHGKLTAYANTAGQQTLHPYYDEFEIEGFRWLYVDFVSNQDKFEITYYVDPPKAVNSVSYSRIFTHFKQFKLENRFKKHALSEMVTILDSLRQEFPNLGSQLDVQAHLKDEAKRRLKRHINAWDSALYDALSQNIPFIGGNYLTQEFNPT